MKVQLLIDNQLVMVQDVDDSIQSVVIQLPSHLLTHVISATFVTVEIYRGDS